MRVRVRGIHATALTKLLKDSGYEVVQQSEVIAERFGEKVRDVADSTVKEMEEDKGVLFAMGEDLSGWLRKTLPYSFVWKSPVKLYSVIEPRDCSFEGLRVEPCLEKGLVVRPPLDGAIRLDEPKAVGKYAMVWRGKGRTYFSEHIPRDERTLLLSISLPWNRKGYDVKWRSNAKEASAEELKEELSRLAMRFDLGDFRNQGEDFAVAVLSLPDKLKLDEVRGQIVRTSRFHHMVKASDSVLADKLDEGVVDVKEALRSLLGERVAIDHVKAPYIVRRLKPGELVEFRTDGVDYYLVLRRELTPGGRYDVLDVEIGEGDYDEFHLSSRTFYGVHVYKDQGGKVKGVLVNVSTPAEILRNRVRYLDLEVDVGLVNGRVVLADERELEAKKEWMGDELYMVAKRTAERVAKVLSGDSFEPLLEDMRVTPA
ncbi:MAG: DUF402 domain-containing protein [Thermoprotei archaeon]